MSENQNFKTSVLAGIPETLPPPIPFDPSISHAPKRKDILNAEEKKLAIQNALRYFNPDHHKILATEFIQELRTYGRVYMYRFRPTYSMRQTY